MQEEGGGQGLSWANAQEGHTAGTLLAEEGLLQDQDATCCYTVAPFSALVLDHDSQHCPRQRAL